MDYAKFLVNCNDNALRKAIWDLYQHVEAFFQSLHFTMTIETVEEGGPAYDAGKKRIEIPVDADNKGVIFHETTNDLFHHSVFHRTQNQVNAFPVGQDDNPNFNESWGEGFCEAVRWLMESKFLPGSEWLTKKFPDEIKSDLRKQRAKQILDYFGWDLDSFVAGWKKLVKDYDMTVDFLNRTIP